MSLVLHYPFNQGSTALLVTDDSVSGSDLTNGGGVTTVNDTTYGDVANFSGGSTASMNLATQPSALIGSASRTVSLWVRRSATSGTQIIYDVGSDVPGRYTSWFTTTTNLRLQYQVGLIDDAGPWAASTWYHIVSTYDGTTVSSYADGVLLDSNTGETLNTGTSGGLTIGNDPNLSGFNFNGYVSDFRVYDGALSAIEVAAMFSAGPNSPSIDATMYSHAAHISWGAVSGASTYQLDTKNSSGDVIQTKSSIVELEASVYNLDDGEVYDFDVYTDLDTDVPVYQIVSSSTPTVDIAETNNMLTFISNDLTSIDNGSVLEIDQYLRDNLNTDETVQARVSFVDSTLRDRTLVFVQELESISIADSPSVLTPFVSGVVSGDVTLELENLSTDVVSFDETANTISMGGSTRSIGDTFIYDGKKVRVSELN